MLGESGDTILLSCFLSPINMKCIHKTMSPGGLAGGGGNFSAFVVTFATVFLGTAALGGGLGWTTFPTHSLFFRNINSK